MPITAISFLIAAISISALPPTNGFLSEWMIFQSMLSSSGIENISLKLVFPFSIFALAITGGLAIACFVKAFGITFLGLHRSENASHAKEVNTLMQIGQILMALVVISLMLFVPFIIKFINLSIPVLNIYDKVFPNIWVMKSVNGNGGSITPLILLFALIVITLAIYFIYKSLNIKEKVYHTWACGYEVEPKNQYSATGFAGPIRKFFTWLYRPKEHKVT
jgi:hydrogenase-4 component B